MHMTAVIIAAEEGGYTSYDPETGTGSQGDTIEEATANLREAVALYLEDFESPSSAAKSKAVCS